MSRGHGRLQRNIVAVLERQDRLVDTFTLAALAYELEPNGENMVLLNDAQLVSVRRALVKLAAEGKIYKIMRGHDKRAYWADERRGLWFTIRDMQQKSLELARTGNHGALVEHANQMLPLITRAQDLGVDFHKPTF